MANWIGLVFYVVVAIISGLIKRSADEKARSRRRASRQDIPDEVVSFEEIEEAVVQVFQEDSEAPLRPMVTEESDHSLSDEEREFEYTKEETRTIPRRPVLGRPDLAQAVIMAEIIRMPRAKRPWPIR